MQTLSSSDWIISEQTPRKRILRDCISDFQNIDTKDTESLEIKMYNTLADVQKEIADALDSAANIISKSVLTEENAKSVIKSHQSILKQIPVLDSFKNIINERLVNEVEDMKNLISAVNEFIYTTNSESIGIRQIAAEQIADITIPGQYSEQDFFEAMNELNDFTAVANVISGGLAIASLFSSAKGAKAAAAVTGVVALGVAVAQTLMTSKRLKDECLALVDCMRDNVDVITENIDYIRRGFEKIKALVNIKKTVISYYGNLANSIGDAYWLYLPSQEVHDYYPVRLDDDTVDILKKICNTFQNVAEHSYINTSGNKTNDTFADDRDDWGL